jgi:hypothetical protein
MVHAMVAWDMIREVYSFVLYRWHTLELLKDSKDKWVFKFKERVGGLGYASSGRAPA